MPPNRKTATRTLVGPAKPVRAGRLVRKRSKSSRPLRWLGLREADAAPGKRHYRFETLASAIEFAIKRADPLFGFLVGESALPEAIAPTTVTLVEEGEIANVLRFESLRSKGAVARKELVVARSADEHSRALRIRYESLRMFGQRDPGHVVRVDRCGTIILPDRHRRETHRREIFAYVAEDLSAYRPLAIAPPGSLGVVDNGYRNLSKQESEQARGEILEMVCRVYDEPRRVGIDVDRLAARDFRIIRRPGRSPQVKFVSAAAPRRRLRPVDLLRALANVRLRDGHAAAPLTPTSAEDFLEAVRRAVGADAAAAWIRAYMAAAAAGRTPRSSYLDDAAETLATNN